MIFETIFTIVGAIVRVIFFATQALPDMPSAITDIGDLISNYASTGITFVFEIVGKPFALAILSLIPIYILFKLTWRIGVFVWTLIKL